MLSFLYGLSYEINITKCIVYLSSVKLPTAHQNDNTSFCIVLMLSVLCGFVWITRRFCLVQNLFTMQWQCQLTNKMSDFKSLLLQIFPLLFFFFVFQMWDHIYRNCRTALHSSLQSRHCKLFSIYFPFYIWKTFRNNSDKHLKFLFSTEFSYKC